MKKFVSNFITSDAYINSKHKPDFNNLLKIMQRQKPNRPTLFEFFMNDRLYCRLTGIQSMKGMDDFQRAKTMTQAFCNAGYDYVTMYATSDFVFQVAEHNTGKTISLNEGTVIYDWDSFEKYSWPDPGKSDYSKLEQMSRVLPEGMKIIVYGPGGVLENVTALVGYENLCFMIADEPELARAIFDAVGSRLTQYYEISSHFDTVGALISNDDWGFKTQTLLSEAHMREYVIPWHKKITEVIHASGKPAILHSCGQLEKVMDDIIDGIGFDAKHSYEDNILSVEQAYEKWGSRIAILGGIDVDFLCRSTPEAIYTRSLEMLERTESRGSYALGSGNSIPSYVPDENFLAMIAAAAE